MVWVLFDCSCADVQVCPKGENSCSARLWRPEQNSITSKLGLRLSMFLTPSLPDCKISGLSIKTRLQSIFWSYKKSIFSTVHLLKQILSYAKGKKDQGFQISRVLGGFQVTVQQVWQCRLPGSQSAKHFPSQCHKSSCDLWTPRVAAMFSPWAKAQHQQDLWLLNHQSSGICLLVESY